MDGLVRLLDPDVVGDFDSGGLIAGAPLEPLRGAERVARQLIGSSTGADARFNVANVNGDPGVVVRIGETLAAVIWLEAHSGLATVIHGVGNPDELGHLRV